MTFNIHADVTRFRVWSTLLRTVFADPPRLLPHSSIVFHVSQCDIKIQRKNVPSIEDNSEVAIGFIDIIFETTGREFVE